MIDTLFEEETNEIINNKLLGIKQYPYLSRFCPGHRLQRNTNRKTRSIEKMKVRKNMMKWTWLNGLTSNHTPQITMENINKLHPKFDQLMQARQRGMSVATVSRKKGGMSLGRQRAMTSDAASTNFIPMYTTLTQKTEEGSQDDDENETKDMDIVEGDEGKNSDSESTTFTVGRSVFNPESNDGKTSILYCPINAPNTTFFMGIQSIVAMTKWIRIIQVVYSERIDVSDIAGSAIQNGKSVWMVYRFMLKHKQNYINHIYVQD